MHVIPAIGPVRMTELRPAAVQAVITKVLAIRSPRTAVNVYRVLSEMLGEAVRWGVIASNPAAAIRPPRAPRPKLHVPDQETCAAILERARGRQVEGPVVLAIGTGMRLGEILGLRWSRRRSRPQGAARRVDAVLRRRRVHRSPRRRPLVHDAASTSRRSSSRSFAASVRSRPSGRWRVRDVWNDHDVVFDDGIGQPLSPWTVSADFRRVVRELGLRGRGSTTCDTPTRRSCWPPACTSKAVSERLGHASTSFTMDTYAAVIPSMGRAAADAAERLFGEGGERL